MRIIKAKTLFQYTLMYPDAATSLKIWSDTVEQSIWKNPNQLKAQFGNASIISSKRVVFDIKGNEYRLIVSINYLRQLIYIIWFGTHEEYNKINAKTINYNP